MERLQFEVRGYEITQPARTQAGFFWGLHRSAALRLSRRHPGE